MLNAVPQVRQAAGSAMARILLVDDEVLILNVLKTVLAGDGHEVVTCQDGEQAIKEIQKQTFDLVISDIRMIPIDGIELLRRIRSITPSLPVILMTGYGTVKSAIEALHLDVFDYIPKPIRVQDFLHVVTQALKYGHAIADGQISLDISAACPFDGLVAVSKSMTDVCSILRRVIPVDVPVLLIGEFGSGRQTVARTIHSSSPRKDAKFVALSCSELPQPLLETALFGDGIMPPAAAGGTILLKDVNMMPPETQQRLEAVLSQRGAAIKDKNARQQEPESRYLGTITDFPSSRASESDHLFRRIKAVEIRIPPLRERPEDVLPLVVMALRKRLAKDAPIPPITSDAQAALKSYPWPGNVSELEKAVEHALANLDAGRITRKSLPQRLQAAVPATLPQAKDDRAFGKNKSLKEFLSKPLMNLKQQKKE